MKMQIAQFLIVFYILLGKNVIVTKKKKENIM